MTEPADERPTREAMFAALVSAMEALEPLAARCDEAVRPDDSDRDGVTVKSGLLRRARAVHLDIATILAAEGFAVVPGAPTTPLPAVKPLVWHETHGGSFIRAESLAGVFEIPVPDPERARKVRKAEATHRERILAELLPSGGLPADAEDRGAEE